MDSHAKTIEALAMFILGENLEVPLIAVLTNPVKISGIGPTDGERSQIYAALQLKRQQRGMKDLWMRELSGCPRRGTPMLLRVGLMQGCLRIRINGRESGLHRRKQPIEPYLTCKKGPFETILNGFGEID
jgi:hypothetical protein